MGSLTKVFMRKVMLHEMLFPTCLLVLLDARPSLGMELGRARRSAEGQSCPAFEPFRCPEEQRCISIQYLCDGAADCSDGYDEDPRLCTAARRPPLGETIWSKSQKQPSAAWGSGPGGHCSFRISNNR